MPEVDVAAALAVVAQGETPLLLDPEPAPQRAPEQRGERPDRQTEPASAPAPLRPTGSPSASATASSPARSSAPSPTRAGSSRGDFGAISIKPDFSLVELPADLPAVVYQKLADTRISGKLIDLRPDRGAPGQRGPRKSYKGKR